MVIDFLGHGPGQLSAFDHPVSRGRARWLASPENVKSCQVYIRKSAVLVVLNFDPYLVAHPT